jgi:hypothetical protein
MKKVSALVAAAALATSGLGYAAPALQDQKSGPVQLTDAQLDKVTAGSPALVDVHNVKVTVQDINVGVNAAVLSKGNQTLTQR